MAIITEQAASIFSAPQNSILIHACNAKGVWGSGVALAFKTHYPSAFHTYRTHCLSPPRGASLSAYQASLAGTALLIPPSDTRRGRHWIACLFTSVGYGRAVSGAAVILGNTEEAMEDLAAQIERLKGEGGREVGGCWGVRINSGRFGVGWESTREVLERGRVDVVVVRPEYEEGEEGEEEGKDVSVPGRAVGKGRGVKRMAESADDGDGKSSKAAKRPTPFLRG